VGSFCRCIPFPEALDYIFLGIIYWAQIVIVKILPLNFCRERRRAEIYALNRKLREEEERKVEAYRQERERRDHGSGTNATESVESCPLVQSTGSHHLAA
jgi:hypothetical protein